MVGEEMRDVGVAELTFVTVSAATPTDPWQAEECIWTGDVGVTDSAFVSTSALTSTPTMPDAESMNARDGEVVVADVLLAPTCATTPTSPILMVVTTGAPIPAKARAPCVEDGIFTQASTATHDTPTTAVHTHAVTIGEMGRYAEWMKGMGGEMRWRGEE